MKLPTVKSEGRTGQQLINRLGRLGFQVGGFARQIINSPQFVVTSNYHYHLESRPHMNDKPFDLWTPIEAGVLLRERLFDRGIEELGVTVLLVMHEPVICSDGFPYILGLCRDGGGGRLVGFCTNGSFAEVPAERLYVYRIR